MTEDLATMLSRFPPGVKGGSSAVDVRSLVYEVYAIKDLVALLEQSPASGYFNPTQPVNTLNLYVPAIAPLPAHLAWMITIDDPNAPALGSANWNNGTVPFPAIITDLLAAFWATYKARLWLKDASSVWQVQNEPSKDDGSGGFLVTPTANANPTKPPFSVDQTGVYAATQFNCLVGTVSTPDDALLTVEIWGAASGKLTTAATDWDGKTALPVLISDRTPGETLYPFARVYVTSDPGRTVDSVQATIQMAAIGGLDNVSVTDYSGSIPSTTPITDITLSAAAIADGCDEILFQTGDSIWDVNDANWQSIVGAATLPVTAYGDIVMYAKIRNAAYPTSLSPTYQIYLSVTAGSGAAVLSFAIAQKTTTEIGAPTLQLPVTKANNDPAIVVFSISTAPGDGLPGYGEGGKADKNYKQISGKQYTLGAGETSMQVPLTTLEDGLGDRDVDLYVDLTIISGADAGQTMRMRIIIQGSHGWLPYVSDLTGLPELDKEAPPAVMPIWSPQNIYGDKTISGARIDGAAFTHAIYAKGQLDPADGSNARTFVLENCDIFNANDALIRLVNYGYIEIRNCLLSFGGQTSNYGPAINAFCESGGNRAQIVKLLNNKIRLCQGGFQTANLPLLDVNSSFDFMHNYVEGMGRTTSATAFAVQMCGYQGGGSLPGKVRISDNGFWQVKRSDGVTYGPREDVINLSDISGTATHPIEVDDNFINGTNGMPSSGYGLQLNDGFYLKPKYVNASGNHVSDISNGDISGPDDYGEILGNFCYQGKPDGTFTEDLGTNPSMSAVIGNNDKGHNYIGLNEVRGWRLSAGGQFELSSFWPSSANAPIGWGKNVEQPAWDDPVVGDLRFRKVRLPIKYPDPCINDDIKVVCFSHDFPLGEVKANFKVGGSTGQLNIAPQDGGAGEYINFDNYQLIDTSNGRSVPLWFVFTDAGPTGPWMLVRLLNGGTNLPAVDKTYTIKVSRFRPIDRGMYVGPSGYRSGSSAQDPVGGDTTAPETPPAMDTLTNPTPTTLRGTCTAALDSQSGVAGYIWRVDADPNTDQQTAGQTSPDFTVTEGTHQMQVSAIDNAGNQTGFSAPKSVGALPGQVATVDTWPRSGFSMTDLGDGTYEFTNTGSTPGFIQIPLTGVLTTGVPNYIYVQQQGDDTGAYRKARVTAFYGTGGPDWTGDLVAGWSLHNAALAETKISNGNLNAPTNTDMRLCIFNESGMLGHKIRVGTARVSTVST